VNARRLIGAKPLLTALLVFGLAVGTVPAAAYANDDPAAAEGTTAQVVAEESSETGDAVSGEAESGSETGHSPEPDSVPEPAPVVTAQPEDLEVVVGAEAVFEIGAGNVTAYHWERLGEDGDPADERAWTELDANEQPSAITERLVFTAEPGHAGSYRVRLTGSGGETVYSVPVGLAVVDPQADADAETARETDADAVDPDEIAETRDALIAPRSAELLAAAADLVVTAHPQPVSAAQGANVRLSAQVSGGVDPVTVQWQRSTALSASAAPTGWTDNGLDRATSPTFTFNAGTSPHQNNRWYRAVFTDGDGAQVITDAVKLTILPAPVVTSQPVGSTVHLGEAATFTATASGDEVTVQWQRTTAAQPNGEADDSTWSDVPDATSGTLTVSETTASSHGAFYRAVFTNAAGATETRAAQLLLFERLDTNNAVTVSGESYGISPGNPFSVSAPNAVVRGESIVIEGFDYLHVDGQQGSVANFLMDAAYSGDPLTLNTTRTVINPATGAEYADKRGHNVAQAGGAGNTGKQNVLTAAGDTVLREYSGWADGYFRVEIPWPTPENTVQDQAFFDEHWGAGSQHTVRILTGSLLSGDNQRGITVRFTVVDEPTGAATAPEIAEQPEDASVVAGEQAVFVASASGTPLPEVRWQSLTQGGAWNDIPGARDGELVVSDTTTAMSGTRYRAVFSNSAGQVITDTATLTVAPSAVGVKTHPVSQGVEAGERARFTAEATGAEVVTRWERSSDGEEWETIRGANDVVLAVEGVTAADAAWRYRARFSNPGNPDGVVTESATLTVIPRENVREYCGESYGPAGYEGARFCFSGPEKVVVGEDIVIQGTGGYRATDGRTGSVINFFLDALYSGDPNTVYVKQPVEHPVTGNPVDDRRTHAMVQAKADGTWTATIPWPTVQTVSSTQDGRGSFSEQRLAQRFAPGTTHAIRMLSGSLLSKPTDVQRGATLFFTVVERLSDPIEVQKPIYPHETYAAPGAGDDAFAWVPTTADSGASFPLTGTGWLTKDGRAGSVIDIRLQDENGAYYRHSGTSSDPNPVSADSTVWQRVHVRESGVLSTRIELPAGVRAGSYVSVRLTTHDDGSALGDTKRDWTSQPVTIDGLPYSPPVSEGCTAAPSEAAYQLAPGVKVPAAKIGGTIRLTGEKWCNSVTGKGSYIAIKINDGAYSHKGSGIAKTFNAKAGKEIGACEASICASNKTIWYVIEADDDGSFDVNVPIPTRSNTNPGFSEGSYTLRIMTGTLAGDPFYGGKREASRTLQSSEFTVVCETCDTTNAKPGKPTAPPKPLHAGQDLTAGTRGGVQLEQQAERWVVTVPKGRPGDWVYVNVYDGTSPRFPWKTEWFELDAKRRAVLPLAGVQLPVGTNKLSVQDRTGGLHGWTRATVAEPEKPVTNPGGATNSARTVLPGVRFATSAVQASTPKPGGVPERPVAAYEDLVRANVGDLVALERDGGLEVSFPESLQGKWVFLFLYTEDGRVVPVDWVRVGSDGTELHDIEQLPSGRSKLAFVGEDGALIGWVAADGGETGESGSSGAAGVPAVTGPAAVLGVAALADDWTLVFVGLALLVLAGSATAVIMLRSPQRTAPAQASAQPS
jgi:hypothetical protein